MADYRKPLALTLSVYLAWFTVTWLLEGRVHTLLRPEAVGIRFAYALFANLTVGLVLSLYVLRTLRTRGAIKSGQIGFRSTRRAVLAVMAGTTLGFLGFVMQRPPTMHPSVLANAFAQVWVVSTAEVLVCWCAVGAVTAAAVRHRGWGVILGTVVASVLFGLYHSAHSPPFNSIRMILVLSAVGLVTSAFFFVTRDLYGTMVFHNFLGMTGVLRALSVGDRIAPLQNLQIPLLTMAAVTVCILVGAHLLWFRDAPDWSAGDYQKVPLARHDEFIHGGLKPRPR